jgi:CDP-diacylglycerol---glycerol-3-phosphate 3-phosphatidyltransferase
VTVANKITTGRLLLTVVLFVLLDLLGRRNANLPGDQLPGWALTSVCFVLFLLITTTDALDGYYARKLGQVSDFGRIADPAADKVIICGSFVFLSAVPWGRTIVPPWIVVSILCREFIVTALRGFMESKGHEFGADPAGKLKMIVQCAAVPAVMLVRMVDDWMGVPISRNPAREGLPLASQFVWWFAVVLVWAALVITVWSGIGYVRKSWVHLREGGL